MSDENIYVNTEFRFQPTSASLPARPPRAADAVPPSFQAPTSPPDAQSPSLCQASPPPSFQAPPPPSCQDPPPPSFQAPPPPVTISHYPLQRADTGSPHRSPVLSRQRTASQSSTTIKNGLWGDKAASPSPSPSSSNSRPAGPSAVSSPVVDPIYGGNSDVALYAVPAQQCVKRLHDGVLVWVYSLKRRPEKMHLRALPELGILEVIRNLRDRPEITVDLSRAQEIRCGWRRSSDFDRWSEDAHKEDEAKCLVLFYGVEALPQSLSIAVRDLSEYKAVVVGLRTLVGLARNQTYQAQRERWFKRQFHNIVSSAPGRKTEEKVSVKQLRGWLLRNSLKVSKKVIMPIINQLCPGDSLRYGAFVSVVTELMRAPVVKKRIKAYVILRDSIQCVTPGTFLKFLKNEQNETAATEADAMAILERYWETPNHTLRSPSKAYLDLSEFEDFLFSPINSVWSPEFNAVHQDMTRPLTEYWIASSHNTYLAGNQIKGLSSEDMYARVLRMGCRCLELDCWDGSDGEPMITHGRTLVTKIRVADVLKVIKDNAWKTSDYPIILSIENHLSLDQQRYLARILKDIFADELLTEPVAPGEQQMPSPEQLKRKIIIKDKKLKEGGSEAEETPGKRNNNLSDTLKLKDPIDKQYYNYSVALTDNSIFFTYEEDEPDEEIDYDEYFDEYDSDDDEDELSYQPWYFGDIEKIDARHMLLEPSRRGQSQNGQNPYDRDGQNPYDRDGQNPYDRDGQNPYDRDGSFLVRNGRAGYTLSFVYEGEIKHVRVKTQQNDEGKTEYTFGNSLWRTSIAELVRHFRTHRLYIEGDNHVLLDKPVCKPLEMEDIREDWYKPEMNRFEAENLLLRIPTQGAFLVRGCSEPGCLSLSFRHKHKISHFQVAKRGRAYVCGSYRFLSLPKMVDYFTRCPLYRKTKLTVPATEDIAKQHKDECCSIYDFDIYNDPFDIVQERKVSVRALYDFMGSEADEMSFTRGAIINNVREEDKEWWKGDYMDQKQKAFPASYVQVIRGETTEARRPSASESIRIREETLELKDCKIDNGPYKETTGGQTLYSFKIIHPRFPEPLQFGCDSLGKLKTWVDAIRVALSQHSYNYQEQIRQERNQKRAKELSDLIVYCQATIYDPSGYKRHYNISSLVEDRIQNVDNAMLQTSRQQMLRVYPKASRITSTNFSPVPMWTAGIQMAALNYQTPDSNMQINQARFLTNGGCGYVLKPIFLREPPYTMDDINSMKLPTEALYLSVTVIAGRNLCAEGRMMGVVRPFVVVEVIGLPLDNRKQRTKAVDEDNGLNPSWNEEAMKFDVSCPEMAFLRFEILSEVNDSRTTIAQATFPIHGLRQGYRSVPLKNCFSEPLDMSSLLVYIDIQSPKDAEERNLFRVIEECRRIRAELLASDSTDQRSGEMISQDLVRTEQKILLYLKTRGGLDKKGKL